MAESYRYPLTKLEKSDDYLLIQILDYKAPGIQTATGTLALRTAEDAMRELGSFKNPKYSIILPIPEDIADSVSASWGDSPGNQLNPLAANLASGAIDIMTSGNNVLGEVGKQFKSFTDKAGGVVKSGGGQQAVTAGITGAALNINPTELISRATGQVFNQNNELLFNSVTLRSFQFSFNFAPRSIKEGQEIKKIIRAFKQSMSPKKGQLGQGETGAFITSPDVFQLEYKSGGTAHKFLNRFKPMALDSMQVNYTASGTYATYSDATPIHMTMALSFKELSPIYNEDYDSTSGKLGVGY